LSPGPDELEALRAGLESNDPAVRARALERLEAVVSERAAEVVAEALQSENPEVRAHAEALRTRLHPDD
jgi:HEAT repeat protein